LLINIGFETVLLVYLYLCDGFTKASDKFYFAILNNCVDAKFWDHCTKWTHSYCMPHNFPCCFLCKQNFSWLFAQSKHLLHTVM